MLRRSCPRAVQACVMAKHGTLLRTTDATLIDRIVASGYDWLMLDGEHASVGLPEVAAMLVTVSGRVPCYVRVRVLDSALITHALAAGAVGVIIPNVDSVPQAEESVHCVRMSRWPKAKVVIQAESAEAVRNIESIVAVPGVEWVLIGPNDLTRSMGIDGQFDHPAYRDAVTAIETACRTAGVPVGIFGMTPEQVGPYQDRGFDWLVTGIDQPT